MRTMAAMTRWANTHLTTEANVTDCKQCSIACRRGALLQCAGHCNCSVLMHRLLCFVMEYSVGYSLSSVVEHTGRPSRRCLVEMSPCHGAGGVGDLPWSHETQLAAHFLDACVSRISLCSRSGRDIYPVRDLKPFNTSTSVKLSQSSTATSDVLPQSLLCCRWGG